MDNIFGDLQNKTQKFLRIRSTRDVFQQDIGLSSRGFYSNSTVFGILEFDLEISSRRKIEAAWTQNRF